MGLSTRFLRWVAASAIALGVVAMPPALTAPLEDISFLFKQLVSPQDTDYGKYTCEPSSEFSDAVACRHELEKSGAAGDQLVSSAVLHAGDGSRLFASVHTSSVPLSREAATKEIADFAAAVGSEPKTVTWTDEEGEWFQVVATWGDIKLTPDIVYNLGAFGVLDEPDDGLFRMRGGAGFAYAASVGEGGLGERYYLAATPEELAIRHFRSVLAKVLTEDKSLPATDYSLWPQVALAVRNLTLNVSAETANREMDALFDAMGSKKLWSRVWAILPLGNTQRLMNGQYWRFDTYGADTKYPEIRAAAQDFIAQQPDDPFVDFAHYVLGDFQGAIDANPNSAIASPLHHALGLQIVQRLVLDGLQLAKSRFTRYTLPADAEELQKLLDGDAATTDFDREPEERFDLDLGIVFLSRHPELFDGKPLSALMPQFAAAGAEARAHFDQVSKSDSVADDVAFMTAWLARQVGELDNAVQSLSAGLQFTDDHADVLDEDSPERYDWVDYDKGLLKEAVRVVEALPAERRLPTVDDHQSFNTEPALWYAAARSMYREFDYASAETIAQAGLTNAGVAIERLPTSTDPDRIYDALQSVDPALLDDYNFVELPYLLAASEEISDYMERLADIASEDPQSLARQARALVVKYSLLIDRPPDVRVAEGMPVPLHKDYRQAIQLISATLEHTAGMADYAKLREWLYYREARILAVFRPLELGAAVAAMEQEFPQSELLDDVKAEQIFAQGIMLGDVEAARASFDEVVSRFASGNAADNAHSWMQIVFRCALRMEEAEAVNDEIIRLYPMTRHAIYARERRDTPDRWGGDECGEYLVQPEPDWDEEEAEETEEE